LLEYTIRPPDKTYVDQEIDEEINMHEDRETCTIDTVVVIVVLLLLLIIIIILMMMGRRKSFSLQRIIFPAPADIEQTLTFYKYFA